MSTIDYGQGDLALASKELPVSLTWDDPDESTDLYLELILYMDGGKGVPDIEQLDFQEQLPQGVKSTVDFNAFDKDMKYYQLDIWYTYDGSSAPVWTGLQTKIYLGNQLVGLLSI